MELVRRWLWPVLSLSLGLAWVGLVIADWFGVDDHLWGQRISEIQGHLALLGLALLLLAASAQQWLPQLRSERRWLGLLTFGFAVTHTFSSVDHNLGESWEGILFLVPWLQAGIGLGIGSVILMIPLALTSFNQAVIVLGRNWYRLHQLIIPVALLAVLHTLIVGVHYLGTNLDPLKLGASGLLSLSLIAIGWTRQQAQKLKMRKQAE